jgi:hypothetical protein
MNITDTMSLAGVKKNSFCRRRFAGVDMSHNTNIADI